MTQKERNRIKASRLTEAFCSACNQNLPVSAFDISPSKHSASGLKGWCRKCCRTKPFSRAIKRGDPRAIRYVTKKKGQRVAASAKRRTSKLNAMPDWANRAAIDRIYKEAQRLTIETGIPHHVDHIVPLQSKHVCGLHIASNLQILTGPENQRKHNKFNIIIESLSEKG